MLHQGAGRGERHRASGSADQSGPGRATERCPGHIRFVGGRGYDGSQVLEVGQAGCILATLSLGLERGDGHLPSGTSPRTSSDGLRWRERLGIRWRAGAPDPPSTAPWNELRNSYVISARPTPHNRPRRVAFSETRDWRTSTEPGLILTSDAWDTPVAEIYRMIVFPDEGKCVGLVWIYHVDSTFTTSTLAAPTIANSPTATTAGTSNAPCAPCGDELTGAGIEVADGLRFTAPRVLMEARGRWFAVHAEEHARELGLGLTARLRPGVQATTYRWP